MTSLKRIRGFTLIEVLIVVVIVSILAAIAYPSYTRYVQKSKRSIAHVALQEAAQRQESYFVRNYSYADSLGSLGYGSDTPDTTGGGEYTLSMTAAAAGGGACDGSNTDACASFVVTAVPADGKSQAHDSDCQVITLDNRGSRRGGVDEDSAAEDTANTCWK